MEIVIIGLVGMFPLLGLLAFDGDSPNYRSNVRSVVHGSALVLAALVLWWFAPLWVRAII